MRAIIQCGLLDTLAAWVDDDGPVGSVVGVERMVDHWHVIDRDVDRFADLAIVANDYVLQVIDQIRPLVCNRVEFARRRLGALRAPCRSL